MVYVKTHMIYQNLSFLCTPPLLQRLTTKVRTAVGEEQLVEPRIGSSGVKSSPCDV